MLEQQPTTAGSLCQQLLRAGLIEERDGQWRTTTRWMGAMSRAAFSLLAADDRGEDLRVPIALALVSLYGSDVSDALLADLVEAMLPIEERELCLGREPRADQ